MTEIYFQLRTIILRVLIFSILSLIFFAQVEGSDLADLLLRDSPEQGDHLHTGQVYLRTFS